MLALAPPLSIAELLQRAQALSGLSLAEIAEHYAFALPPNLKREKGSTGLSLESILGASATSLPMPDFPELGVELKTIPINLQGKPCESTFVCVINYQTITQEQWETSLVWRKLQRVLWLPIQGERSIPLAERCVGTPLLWEPTQQQMATLRQDWLELTELILLGRLDQISARLGTALQIRPKALDSHARTAAVNEEGAPIATLPRGFYLRARFTMSVLEDLRLR